MNRDLAKYILSLKDEISLRIWLGAISKSARNGTANLMYKDLMLENRLTRPQIDKYFNPYEAERLEVIKILARSENFISINFRAGTKQKAGAKQLKLITQSENPEVTEVKKQEVTTTAEMVPSTETNTLPKVKGFLPELPAKNYNPTQALTQSIIGDYILFFKQLQVDKAALIGRAINIEDTADPKIEPEDAKHLRELAKHFATFREIKNEDQVRRCFHRIYVNWWNFNDWIKTKPEPRFLRYNINTIIMEIQNINNNNGKTNDKRENELNSKIKRAQSKDYSHLAKTRKKDD